MWKHREIKPKIWKMFSELGLEILLAEAEMVKVSMRYVVLKYQLFK